MRPRVSLDALEFALLRTADQDNGNRALVCRRTGEIYVVSESEEFSDPDLPEDIDDPQAYVELPDKRDLDLGQRLVFDFVAERAPGQLDTVRGFFSRRGAYGRFKDLLEREGLLEVWHAFEDGATARALCEWARNAGFEVVDDRPDRPDRGAVGQCSGQPPS